MPIFKTTDDILKTFKEELFDENQNNYPFLTLPPSPSWDAKREMDLEDVDIWEVIFEGGGGTGLYAAWCPYDKFFMLRYKTEIDTFYGEEGEKRLEKRLKELNLLYPKA
jgi:hypothetical protein